MPRALNTSSPGKRTNASSGILSNSFSLRFRDLRVGRFSAVATLDTLVSAQDSHATLIRRESFQAEDASNTNPKLPLKSTFSRSDRLEKETLQNYTYGSIK